MELVSRRKDGNTAMKDGYSFSHLACPGNGGTHWFWVTSKGMVQLHGVSGSLLVIQTAFCGEEASKTGSTVARATCVSLSSPLQRMFLNLGGNRIR